MLLPFLGKLLFPDLAEWQQKKKVKAILWAIPIALLFAAIMVAAMFFVNSGKTGR
ncbi:MAG: hypothetical protein WBS33_00485 [Verrucomicrobiia bacterium]